MEQLFKLDKELRHDTKDMFAVRTDVQQLESTLKRQELKSQGHPAKVVVKIRINRIDNLLQFTLQVTNIIFF